MSEYKKYDPIRLSLLIFSVLLLATLTYLVSRNREITHQYEVLENSQKSLELEMKQLDELIIKKDSEIQNKEQYIKEVSAKLDMAQKRIAYLEQTGGADEKQLAEYRAKLLRYEQEVTGLKKDVETITKEKIVYVQKNNENTTLIKDYEEKLRQLEAKLDKKSTENQELVEKMSKKFSVVDIQFFDSKNESNVSFRKGRMNSFKTTFKVRDVEYKILEKGLEGITVIISGMSEKNASFNRTLSTTPVDKGEIVARIDGEKFEVGMYRVEYIYNGTLIGQSKFEVESFF